VDCPWLGGSSSQRSLRTWHHRFRRWRAHLRSNTEAYRNSAPSSIGPGARPGRPSIHRPQSTRSNNAAALFTSGHKKRVARWLRLRSEGKRPQLITLPKSRLLAPSEAGRQNLHDPRWLFARLAEQQAMGRWPGARKIGTTVRLDDWGSGLWRDTSFTPSTRNGPLSNARSALGRFSFEAGSPSSSSGCAA